MIAEPIEFRYNDIDHSYWLNGSRIPSVTQLVDMGGLVTGQQFMTEASRDRGTEVHRLCADWDMGVVDLVKCDSPQRGYLLGYVAACASLKPTWDAIEEADVEPSMKFAGRIDRVGQVFGRLTICEIKSAVKQKHHAVQTALQSLLIAWRRGLPAEEFQRLVIYLKHTGRYSVERHEDRRDFDQARRLIKEFC